MPDSPVRLSETSPDEAMSAMAVWLAWSPDRSIKLHLAGDWRAEVSSARAETWGYGETLSDAIADALREAEDGGL